jgi:membrane protein
MGIAHARQFGQREILKQATALMGAQAADAIKPIIDSRAAQDIGLLPTAVSTVVLLFSATSVFNELHASMNSIWGLETKALEGNRAEHAVLSFIRSRLLSLAMVYFLGLLLVVFLFITGIHATLQGDPTGLNRWTDYFASAAISLAVEFALFVLMFKFVPSAHPKLKNVCPGALIAALLFSAGRFGLAIYFKHSSISSAYGAAGSLVAVFTWIYYSSFSLFYGAEFTKAWTRRFDPGHAPSYEEDVSEAKTRA